MQIKKIFLLTFYHPINCLFLVGRKRSGGVFKRLLWKVTEVPKRELWKVTEVPKRELWRVAEVPKRELWIKNNTVLN